MLLFIGNAILVFKSYSWLCTRKLLCDFRCLYEMNRTEPLISHCKEKRSTSCTITLIPLFIWFLDKTYLCFLFLHYLLNLMVLYHIQYYVNLYLSAPRILYLLMLNNLYIPLYFSQFIIDDKTIVNILKWFLIWLKWIIMLIVKI